MDGRYSVKRWGHRFLLVGILLLAPLRLLAAGPVIDCVEVKTRAKENALIKVWYRVPRSYDPQKKGLSRVLILFGGRNCDGRPEVSGKLGWTEWADLNGIFLVAPTLKDDSYWEPEKWSGRAVLDALAQIAAKYRIATSGLLYYGYSAGSQASNLFPAWRPDLCRAYVSHACGVFHVPSLRMKDVPGLVTCGDADTARYVISRQFVEKYRSLGVSVIWKSFPNHSHDVPPDSIRLAKEFLAHWHWRRADDLSVGRRQPELRSRTFVGDDADGVFYSSDDAELADILAENRVELPSETVALAWGRPGRVRECGGAATRLESETIGGVEVVFAVPNGVRSDSRILVLCGGRGWSGERSVRELGFAEWALERNWCVIAPSFERRVLEPPQRFGGSHPDGCRLAVREMRHPSAAGLSVRLFGRRTAGRAVAGARSFFGRRLGGLRLRGLSGLGCREVARVHFLWHGGL